MSRNNNTINPVQRLSQIRKAISCLGEVSIKDLSKEAGVSEITIRRDLELLKSQGEIIISRGVVASAKRLTFDFTFSSKQQKNHKQKIAIAKKAIDYINDGDVVILDTGTTTLEIARHLIGRRKVKVITTSLAIVSKLQFAEDIEIILLGGQLRNGSPDLHGPLTEKCLDFFNADVAFVGADAVDSQANTYTGDLKILGVDRKITECSKKVIIVADSSKLDQSSMCKVFSRKDYELLITDSGAEDIFVQKLIAKGIKIELT